MLALLFNVSESALAGDARGADVSAAPTARVAGSRSAVITSIAVEHDCNGCANGSAWVLHRDGAATYTLTGNARMGTSDRTSRATVRVQDFDALARLAVARGFFDWDDEYADPELQDGAWTRTRIVRGGTEKSVFRRDDAGPAGLKELEAAIDGLRARTALVPDP